MYISFHTQLYIYIRWGKLKIPTSVEKQIQICTQSLRICTADLCLYCAPWRSTNFIQVYIYRSKTMTICRVLYLSAAKRITFVVNFTLRYVYLHIHVYSCIYIYAFIHYTYIYIYIYIYTYIYI